MPTSAPDSPVTAATDAGAPPRQIGRFQLLRLLGRGTQASVWLARDPWLERDVAIKLLAPARGGRTEAHLQRWLAEARHMGQLSHPAIVPVFEADVQERQAFTVFEYVNGASLAEHLAAKGRCTAHEAAAMMVDVLDALQAAHAAGIVHRDLKPSNIMIDAQGRARVMDFGISVSVANAAHAPLAGTPAYMAPEASAGAVPTPAVDIYGAGLILVELLTGQPLRRQSETWQALYPSTGSPVTLPDDLGPDVDDALRAIAARALAREPAQRYASAAEFRDALRAWASPEPGAAQPVGNATLDFLLLRMRRKSDFPALSDTVVRIQRVATSEDDSVGDLTREILKDVALTNKLLRLVNSPLFAHANRGGVSTVSRAVTLLGFNTIRNMALSLVLLEHMQDKAHAEQMREEFLRAMMAGALAAEMGGNAGSESSFIGAMLQNLGRMLCSFYFPEEAAQIRALHAAGKAEGAAATQVLGLTLEDLGVGVARAWGLPETLQRCMRTPMGAPPMRPPQQGDEHLRWLVRAANEVAGAMLQNEPPRLTTRLQQLAIDYRRTLQLTPESFSDAVLRARQQLVDIASALDLRVTPGSPAERLLQSPEPPPETNAAADPLAAHALRADPTLPAPADAALGGQAATQHAAQVLAAGIQDITDAMVDDSFKLNDILRMILETMLRALNARRIVFALRDARTDVLRGRLGLGECTDADLAALAVPLHDSADLFATVCQRGADTLIADTRQGRLHERLPAWFRSGLNAPAFLLLPLQMKGKPFALIYADHDRPGALAVDDQLLGSLRSLRNQAIMAFRQRGGDTRHP